MIVKICFTLNFFIELIYFGMLLNFLKPRFMRMKSLRSEYLDSTALLWPRCTLLCTQMSATRKGRKRRSNRLRRKKTANVSFTGPAAESDKATTNFVNLHRLTTNRTFWEREKFRLFERRKAEGLVARFAEILLGTIVRMSIFAEVRRTTVWTFDH